MMLHVPTCIAMCIASADVASVHGPPLSILVDMIRNRAGMFSSLIPWFLIWFQQSLINSCLAKLRFTYHVMIFYGNALKINSESLIPDSRISYIDWLVILYLIPEATHVILNRGGPLGPPWQLTSRSHHSNQCGNIEYLAMVVITPTVSYVIPISTRGMHCGSDDRYC